VSDGQISFRNGFTVTYSSESVTRETEDIEIAEPKGYISLNYYNLFWIFVICSVIGIIVETAYQLIVFGRYELRAGLVWGPFSPIYGIGGVLFTIALNRFWDKNVIVIFAVSMVLGSLLEFCTSWIMETMFGIISWDYSGTFGSIEGRTNFAFGMMWGALGLLWVRLALPWVLRIIDFIPWRYHIVITIGMSIFMAMNIVITVAAIDRQYERLNNIPATNLVQTACDEYFPDNWIKKRFPNVNMDVTRSRR